VLTPATGYAASWAAAVGDAVSTKLTEAARIVAVPILIAAQLPANRHGPAARMVS
jgi:hypothetical protein